jgi:hypothetical protein
VLNSFFLRVRWHRILVLTSCEQRYSIQTRGIPFRDINAACVADPALCFHLLQQCCVYVPHPLLNSIDIDSRQGRFVATLSRHLYGRHVNGEVIYSTAVRQPPKHLVSKRIIVHQPTRTVQSALDTKVSHYHHEQLGRQTSFGYWASVPQVQQCEHYLKVRKWRLIDAPLATISLSIFLNLGQVREIACVICWAR